MKYVVLFIFCFSNFFLYGQNKIDSLENVRNKMLGKGSASEKEIKEIEQKLLDEIKKYGYEVPIKTQNSIKILKTQEYGSEVVAELNDGEAILIYGKFNNDYKVKKGEKFGYISCYEVYPANKETFPLTIMGKVEEIPTTQASINGIPIAKIDVDYVEIVGFQKFLTTQVIVTLDFGQQQKMFKVGELLIRDSTGKPISFNSMIDALNFMSQNGYEFQTAYIVTEGNQNVYHYLMKKRKI